MISILFSILFIKLSLDEPNWIEKLNNINYSFDLLQLK